MSDEPRPGTCRSCHAAIVWVKNQKTGKWSPMNRDGTSHFATCPQAKDWRRPAGKPITSVPVPRRKMDDEEVAEG